MYYFAKYSLFLPGLTKSNNERGCKYNGNIYCLIKIIINLNDKAWKIFLIMAKLQIYLDISCSLY